MRYPGATYGEDPPEEYRYGTTLRCDRHDCRRLHWRKRARFPAYCSDACRAAAYRDSKENTRTDRRPHLRRSA